MVLIFQAIIDKWIQFTSNQFTGQLEKDGIRISMDDKGRALDNVFENGCSSISFLVKKSGKA